MKSACTQRHAGRFWPGQASGRAVATAFVSHDGFAPYRAKVERPAPRQECLILMDRVTNSAVCYRGSASIQSDQLRNGWPSQPQPALCKVPGETGLFACRYACRQSRFPTRCFPTGDWPHANERRQMLEYTARRGRARHRRSRAQHCDARTEYRFAIQTHCNEDQCACPGRADDCVSLSKERRR